MSAHCEVSVIKNLGRPKISSLSAIWLDLNESVGIIAPFTLTQRKEIAQRWNYTQRRVPISWPMPAKMAPKVSMNPEVWRGRQIDHTCAILALYLLYLLFCEGHNFAFTRTKWRWFGQRWVQTEAPSFSARDPDASRQLLSKSKQSHVATPPQNTSFFHSCSYLLEITNFWVCQSQAVGKYIRM